MKPSEKCNNVTTSLSNRFCPGKAVGLDSNRVLKACAALLCGVLQYIFNLGLSLERVPVLWKTSCLVPVPKKTRLTPPMNTNQWHWLSTWWGPWRGWSRHTYGPYLNHHWTCSAFPSVQLLLNLVTMESYMKEIRQLINSMVVFYEWPQGGAMGAIIKYVVHMLMENLFTKLHFITVNRIVVISCFNVTVAPPVGIIVWHPQLDMTSMSTWKRTTCMNFYIVDKVPHKIPLKKWTIPLYLKSLQYSTCWW